MKRGFGLIAAALLGACALASPELPDDLLAGGEDFIEVPREMDAKIATARQGLGNAPVVVQDGDHNFYLAVRRERLAERWFLSAYTKQWFPGDVQFGFADFSLGTRVVSFKEQNGKLFVFDASNQFKSSEVEDPTILLEAWPIVESREFDRLPGADRYVLVDTSAGLNKFAVTGDLFADPSLAAFGSLPFRVGLSFMQNFRQLSDGATFEEVFTGDFAGSESAWGTLGISLRRYAEGQGFTPAEDPGAPFYFLSDFRLVPNTGDLIEANPVKFNFKRGMRPIDVLITQGAKRAQADFPDVDVLGAFRRGVETWNSVFGFPVFRAVFVDNDKVPDDDKSFVLVDYPGGGPFAFADWRSNPNNGETRGMSVYFGGVFFDDFPFFEDDLQGPPPPPTQPVARPNVRTLTWGGMPAQGPGCVYWSPRYQEMTRRVRGDSQRTAQEKSALFIQHVVAHEVGHTLGLRHNFAGSLEPPSSSVMDYLDDFSDAIELGDPGSYDRDAIRFLYGLSPDAPFNHAFCTDEDVGVNPLCQTFDSGADPLHDWWAPDYNFIASLVIDFGFSPVFLDIFDLNQILAFARDRFLVAPPDRAEAVSIALDRSAVPAGAADAANPVIAGRLNVVADKVLRRIVLDAPAQRGDSTANVSDPGVIALVASQAGRMLRNEDRIRTLALRRTAVDVLKGLQSDAAFLQLRDSRTAIQAALAGGQVPPADVPFVEDLLARIQTALSPYFN